MPGPPANRWKYHYLRQADLDPSPDSGWHLLEIRVRQDGLSSTVDGEHTSFLDMQELAAIHDSTMQPVLDGQSKFDARLLESGSIGVVLVNAAARFRNLKITPLFD